MSNNDNDHIRELEIFEDENCETKKAFSEEINPYRIMHNWNYAIEASKNQGSGACDLNFKAEVTGNRLRVTQML